MVSYRKPEASSLHAKIELTSFVLKHRLNFKALSRALSIRTQLAKYLKRFEIPIISCGEDHTKVRRCLTSGYFRNAAKVQPDGTYRSVRENAVSICLSLARLDSQLTFVPLLSRSCTSTPALCYSLVHPKLPMSSITR